MTHDKTTPAVRASRLERLVGRLITEADGHQTVFEDDRRRKALFIEAAGAVSILLAALEQAEAIACNCVTNTRADGTRRTWCGSSQMRLAVADGHAFHDLPPNVEVQGQDEAQLRTVPLERPVGRKEE